MNLKFLFSIKLNQKIKPFLNISYRQDGRQRFKLLGSLSNHAIDINQYSYNNTLENLSLNNINDVDILKIDTQGYEDKVLQGAQQLLKNEKIKMIQLELIFSEIYEKPLQIFDVEKFLIANNYKLFSISNGGSLISHYVYQADFIYIYLLKYTKTSNQNLLILTISPSVT